MSVDEMERAWQQRVDADEAVERAMVKLHKPLPDVRRASPLPNDAAIHRAVRYGAELREYVRTHGAVRLPRRTS